LPAERECRELKTDGRKVKIGKQAVNKGHNVGSKE